jgi:hypothetical protein
MNPLPAEIRDLCDLFANLHDGDPSPGDWQRVEARLHADRSARQLYLRYMRVCAGLAWDLRELSDGETVARVMSPKAAARPRLSVVSPVLGFLGGVWDLAQSSPRALFVILGGSLAGYFVVMMALIPLARLADATRHVDGPAQNSAQSVTGAQIGSLRSDPQARWSKQFAHSPDESLRIGERYELARGHAEINLAQGVRVTIEGPAVWQLKSEQRLQLDSGTLAAQVSRQAIGFTVATPCADVVDLGTEFGVTVAVDGRTDVHVLNGKVEVRPPSSANIVEGVQLVAGEAVRAAAIDKPLRRIAIDRSKFTSVLRSVSPDPKEGNPVTRILLGNLFDDRPRTPLADAMRTDTYQAEADLNDLGVSRVLLAGEPVQQIAPGVRFDLTNLGWQGGQGVSSPVNDAWSVGPTSGGISVTGNAKSAAIPRGDEGVGMHANVLVTFDLDELRNASGSKNQAFDFVADYTGVNDTAIETITHGSVHMAAIVSTVNSVQAAVVDGQKAEVSEHEQVWCVTSEIGEPMRPGGPFVPVRMHLPATAKYLTLVAASAGDGIDRDHAVWVGARLELVP